MESKNKIEYAKKLAKELEGKKTTNEVKNELKSEGVDDQVIVEIMIRTRNILADKYSTKIREYLKKDKEIQGSEDFLFLEDGILNSLKKIELQKLTDFEMDKITELVNNNVSGEEILDQVDTRFLSLDIAVPHINGLESVKSLRKDGDTGGFGLLRGIRLLFYTGLFFAFGRLSFALIFLVVYFLYWLFTKNDTQYGS